jgi:SAM-dependent methyltransferase
MTSSLGSQELQQYYAARAPYYDDVYLKPERAGDIAFLAGHLPALFRARTVLEAACGTGYWTQHIAPAASRMVATDGTAQPLALARARPGTGQVVFRQADAHALPPDLGTFDGAFAGLILDPGRAAATPRAAPPPAARGSRASSGRASPGTRAPGSPARSARCRSPAEGSACG